MNFSLFLQKCNSDDDDDTDDDAVTDVDSEAEKLHDN
jgi:hypothetical protein